MTATDLTTGAPFEFTHHHASMQILPSGRGSRFLWTTDFKPDALEEAVAPIIDASVDSIKAALAG